ncbi:uncharacterized protein LOC127849054 [Dreissena polymorpha]|nr:uncharacterized protein LOC127849054 [Dreissena polymorpha]
MDTSSMRQVNEQNNGYIFQASGKWAKQWIHLPCVRQTGKTMDTSSRRQVNGQNNGYIFHASGKRAKQWIHLQGVRETGKTMDTSSMRQLNGSSNGYIFQASGKQAKQRIHIPCVRRLVSRPNKEYIFNASVKRAKQGIQLPASGHQIRDDDEDEDYGGVVYIYNATNVIVATPKKANDRLGNSIYTGVSPYWVGPNSQTSGSVEVRVRCWKASSLPIPEYSLTNRNITAATGSGELSWILFSHHCCLSVNKQLFYKQFLIVVAYVLFVAEVLLRQAINKQKADRPFQIVKISQVSEIRAIGDLHIFLFPASDSYVKVNHGLGGYPSLVVSRVNVRWEKENCTVYADSVGASGMVYAGNGYYQTNGYVVVGYDAFNIQVWTPSDAAGRLLGLGDGLGIILEAKSGSLELYAWSQSRLPATSGATKELNASQAGADKELSFTAAGSEDQMFTRALIQSDSAPNVGYRFPGNGYLAYETTNYSQPCTYGGLVYAYTNESARVWQPAYATGALICLASCLGNGTNSQASNEGTVVLQSWELDTDECRASPCQHGVRCVNRFRGYSCECESGYEGQNCDVNVDDCVNHACQNGATCSDLVNEYNCSCAPGFEGDKCQTATATSPLTSTGTTAVTPTHGGWSDWQEWQLCSVTCGTGVRRRYRLCNNPPPVDGSSQCAGASYEEAACNSGTTCPAAPAEATWGPWSATSSCSVTCGYGTQLRVRLECS